MKKLSLALALVAISAPVALAQNSWPSDVWTDSNATHSGGPFSFQFFNKSNKHLESYRWADTKRSFSEASGVATLKGWVVSTYKSSRRFYVDLRFSGFVASSKTPPAKSPYLFGLRSSALASRGGPIDPRGWRYYTRMSGSLKGGGDLSGWMLQMTRYGPSAQAGVGANLNNAHNGFSAWYTPKVVRKGSRAWLSGVRMGDLNLNLDAGSGPNDCIAYYPFDHNKLESCDEEKCSKALDLAGGRRLILGRDQVLLSRSDWYASSRNSRTYDSSFIEAGIDPDTKNKCSMTNKEFCFDLYRNNGSSIRFVDVRYDEDIGAGGNNFRTVVATVKLPATGRNFTWSKTCIDLSKIPQLQNLRKSYDVRLYFYGMPMRGWSRTSTGLDNVALCGEGKPHTCPTPALNKIDNPVLETITQRCFRLRGTNLKFVTEVKLSKLGAPGSMVIKSQDADDFGNAGYFVKLRDGSLCVYPPLCKLGTFELSVRNSACGSSYSRSLRVRFVEPKGNKQAVPPVLDTGKVWCDFLYGKNKNNYYCIFASPFKKPSRIPGVIDLGIGDMFKILIAFDGPGPKCYKWCVGKWPAAVKGHRIYFQTLVVDLDNFSKLPLEVTGVGSTVFR